VCTETYNKGLHLSSKLFTFRPHCEPQCGRNSLWGTSLNELFTFQRNSSSKKNSSIKKYSITTSILVWFKKKFIFLKWRWKTGLNGPIKSPKFEKKFKRERTSNFCILWAYCEQIVIRLWADCERQSRGKSKWSRKTSHNVSRIPLTMWGTNLNEDAYCLTCLTSRPGYQPEKNISWKTYEKYLTTPVSSS